jgi:hypothetical protein
MDYKTGLLFGRDPAVVKKWVAERFWVEKRCPRVSVGWVKGHSCNDRNLIIKQTEEKMKKPIRKAMATTTEKSSVNFI